MKRSGFSLALCMVASQSSASWMLRIMNLGSIHRIHKRLLWKNGREPSIPYSLFS